MLSMRVLKFRYGMEVHIVHYKQEYGSFENALTYSDGICVIGFFGEVTETSLVNVLFYDIISTNLNNIKNRKSVCLK